MVVGKFWKSLKKKMGIRASVKGTKTDEVPVFSQERRREERFELHRGEPLRIRVDYKGEYCEVLNLSTQGLGFRAPPSFSNESLGSEIQTAICVEETYFPVTLHPLYCSNGVVGCRVTRASQDWQQAAEKYLEPRRAGSAIREIHPDFLKREEDGYSIRWFQGLAGCDLFVWSGEDGKIRRVQFFYYSGIVEWSPVYGLRTGRLQEDIGFDKRLLTIEADIYGFSTNLDQELLKKTRAILSASSVPLEILAYFQEHP